MARGILRPMHRPRVAAPTLPAGIPAPAGVPAPAGIPVPARRHRPVPVRGLRPALAHGLAVAFSLVLAGCSSDTMLLESDVPLPEGMATIRSADIKRAQGTVSGGTFLLAGEVDDARASVDRAARRFDAHGWTVSATDGTADAASGRFTKDGRTASLSLRRRSLDPAMSSGALTIESAPR